MASNPIVALMNTLGWVKVSKLGEKFFYTAGGTPSDFWGEQNAPKYLKDFLEIPVVNAIINYRAKAESRADIKIVSKTTGQEPKSRENLLSVVKNPNWFQSQKELFYQQSLFRGIFGNEYYYFLKPIGFPNSIKAIYGLPSQHVYIKCMEKLFFLEPKRPDDVEYKFWLPGDEKEYDLDINNILHLNDNRVSFAYDKPNDNKEPRKNYLYGSSKLASLTPALKNLRIAYEGRHSLRTLPAGILSNTAKDAVSTTPMKKGEKEKLQRDLKNYSLSLDKYQLIISGLSLKLNETIVDIGKMKLYEEMEADAGEIADAYGVPPELMSFKKNITYENKKYAEKQMYEDTIIPAVQERVSALNNYLGTANKSWEIQAGFSHLPIFQDNMQERSTTVKNIVEAMDKALAQKAITLDDYKAELAKYGIGTKE